jgi:uncharacterized protein (DUF952 family)
MLPHDALLHVALPEAWESQRATGRYRPAGFEKEGFIHCCHPRQLERVLRDHFKDVDEVLLLVLDRALIASEIKYERAANDEYPHIYGPIEPVAVLEVIPTMRVTGVWRLP